MVQNIKWGRGWTFGKENIDFNKLGWGRISSLRELYTPLVEGGGGEDGWTPDTRRRGSARETFRWEHNIYQNVENIQRILNGKPTAFFCRK